MKKRIIVSERQMKLLNKKKRVLVSEAQLKKIVSHINNNVEGNLDKGIK